MTIHDPPGDGPIDRLYVVMSVDEEGRMGICASLVPGLGATPLVASTRKNIEYMAKHAAPSLLLDAQRMKGRRLAIVSFWRDTGDPEWLTR